MDDDNDGINIERDRFMPMDEEGGLRRNQVLIFGVILLGILAICLAVTMPSDLEFHDADLASASVPVITTDDTENTPLSNSDSSAKTNQSNSTSNTRKIPLRNSEVSVEVKLLRDMAIQRKIQEYDSSKTLSQPEESVVEKEFVEEEDPHRALTKEESEDIKVRNIVETFMKSEDYEDFVIDMEIHDAVRKLREEKGYKNRPSSLFDELFKRAEKEFIGDDEEELRLIRRVGDELERRARETITERKISQGQDLTEPKQLLADELSKFDFSGSGNSEDEMEGNTDEQEVMQVKKTEL